MSLRAESHSPIGLSILGDCNEVEKKRSKTNMEKSKSGTMNWLL